MFKVFIDGQAGTTGLRIAERLTERPDIELVEIQEGLRKDIASRLDCILEADVSVLCLPDEDAREIAAAAPPESRIIDCSTAHRVKPDWVYGMPEVVSGIEGSARVANPGCHATGFIMSVRPLIDSGILDKSAQISFHSLTGYSGGGKPMISEYKEKKMKAPRQYALSQEHKHIPEMRAYSGFEHAPVFSPIVCDFYCGMLVSVPLRTSASAKDIRDTLADYYEVCQLVKIREIGEEFSEAAGAGFLSADAFAGRDDIEIFVTGKDDRIEIVSRYDNLGKGASGAAIQNMNIMLGLPEETGLVTGT